MASQSSSNSSNSQYLNKTNELPNSDSEVQEHNFFGPVRVGSSSDSPNNNEGNYVNNNEKKIFDSKLYLCNYCKGQYSSLQALGGHQNAHKAERTLQMQLIKQKYDGDTFNLGQPRFNPYLNRPITPFSPYNYRPLRVRMESMIQKSPYISPRPIGHGALRLHELLNPSLVSLRNNIQGSNNGALSLGIGGATTSRIEDQVGRNGAILKIGQSSTSMNGILNLKLNIEEEPSDSESSGLDLSLKL